MSAKWGSMFSETFIDFRLSQFCHMQIKHILTTIRACKQLQNFASTSKQASTNLIFLIFARPNFTFKLNGTVQYQCDVKWPCSMYLRLIFCFFPCVLESCHWKTSLFLTCRTELKKIHKKVCSFVCTCLYMHKLNSS